MGRPSRAQIVMPDSNFIIAKDWVKAVGALKGHRHPLGSCFNESDVKAVQANVFKFAAEEARKMNDGYDWPISRLLDEQAEKL